jgi:hypothetical protein
MCPSLLQLKHLIGGSAEAKRRGSVRGVGSLWNVLRVSVVREGTAIIAWPELEPELELGAGLEPSLELGPVIRKA